MIGTVTVMSAAGYQAWLSGSGDGPLSARGEQLFSQLACNTCHLTDGTGRGPSLAGKFGTEEQLANGATVNVDESYLRESILNPQAKLVNGYQPLMPTFQGLVNEEGVMALIEDVKSLQGTGRPGTQTAPAAAAAAPAAQENR
jgi:cytochrome c oxidase subunit 2